MYKVGRLAGFVLVGATVIGLAGGAIYLLWSVVPWLVAEVVSLYKEADPEFRLGLLTAVLSTAGVVWSVIYQRRKEVDALRFEKKREAYGVFFDLLFDFMKASDTGTDLLADPSLKDKFRDLTKRMMIWGSAKTVNAFNKFQVDSLTPTDDIKVTFARMETLLRQFRADLGHRDGKLQKFALTKLILKSDEHDKLDA